MTSADRRTEALRLAAQGLTRRTARSPGAVVRHLLAVQAQDLRGARLSVRSRSTGVTAADVDAALGDRSLVVSWLNRGTLHLVAAEDYWWLHPLTTPQLGTGNARRLRQEGVSAEQAERGVEVVTEAVRAGAVRTRADLRARLDGAGVPTAGQALVHVLLLASLRGVVLRGPVVEGEQAFVSVRDWLGEEPAALDREEALGRLARRYLAAHGPADAADLARWAGVPLGQARRGIAAIGSELDERDDGLVDLRGRRSAAAMPAPRLLGPFDPLLLGWVSRDAVVGPHLRVVTSNGLIRPVALVDGRVVASWGLANGTVTLTCLEPVATDVLGRLRTDAAAVLRFLGLPRTEPVVR